MRTKSKGDLNAQIERIRKTFYALPGWRKKPGIGRMVLAKEICERYHSNINNYLGEYDEQNDEAEFYRRHDLQLPASVYAKQV